MVEPIVPDPRNKDIQVYIGGNLYARENAAISVFDSVVQGGDAVWEGLRVYDGKIFAFDKHLLRLRNSAKAMAFSEIPSEQEIRKAVFRTLEANGMTDDTHIRLTLTRGKKVTSYMDPEVNRYGPTLIVLAEWKKPLYSDRDGLKLITAATRRNPSQCIDSKIHHNNLINNILAKIEANVAGVDGAVMLDTEGFVSEVNATNIFFIYGDRVFTPFADSCLPGITRQTVIDICKENNIPVSENRISISEMYMADECFTTGTMGELAPVKEIDGRGIGERTTGPVTTKIRELFRRKTATEGEPLPFVT